MQVRNSERTTFLQCRWKWYWSYDQCRKSNSQQTALRFGDLVHQALAAFYKKGVRRGPQPAKTFDKLYLEQIEAPDAFGLAHSDSEWRDARELGVTLLESYYKEYGKDDQYKILICEQEFSAPVLGTDVMYVGTMDGVWQDRDTGHIHIVDHKTTKAIDTSMLYIDEQASSYWTYGVDWLISQGILKDASELRGMIYNFLRKAKPDSRQRDAAGLYLNKDGSVSKNQPAKMFERYITWRDEADRAAARSRISDQIKEIKKAKNGRLAIYKSPGLFNVNCRSCSFKDVCELHETGSDWEEMLRLTTSPYDPYEAHKK